MQSVRSAAARQRSVVGQAVGAPKAFAGARLSAGPKVRSRPAGARSLPAPRCLLIHLSSSSPRDNQRSATRSAVVTSAKVGESLEEFLLQARAGAPHG